MLKGRFDCTGKRAKVICGSFLSGYDGKLGLVVDGLGDLVSVKVEGTVRFFSRADLEIDRGFQWTALSVLDALSWKGRTP